MKPLKAVIFDVDGTLVDSERDGHRVAFNQAFDEARLPDHWDEQTYGRLLTIAGGRQRLTAWFEETGRPASVAQDLAARIHQRKTALMRELVTSGRIEPRPGVPKLLNTLRDHGIDLHVATTGTRAWVEPLLDGLFPGYFSTIVTGTEVPELKPNPAAYLHVLELTGLRPDGTVVIEDSGNGVAAAVAAGLRCLAVYNPYTQNDDFRGAALVVDDFDAPNLAAWFDRRLRSTSR